MALKTTDSLYTLITKAIDSRISYYMTGKQSGTLQSLTGLTTYSDRDLNEVVNELSKIFVKTSELYELSQKLEDLSEAFSSMVDEVIVEGLDVTATSPPSMKVNISLGYGGKRGRPCRLDEAKTVTIPADSSISTYFITIQSYGQVNVRNSEIDTELTLAKIVIPNPGFTFAIQNDKDNDSYDGYIISAKDMYFDEDTVFDDASMAVLRDAIGDILADNLIGNIRLSENLKILNTSGTLELDSQSVKIKDETGNLLAQFNSNGTFFYDSVGTEVAKFGSDEARIGNIVVTPSTIESGNFASGAMGSGFRIDSAGDAWLNNAFLRGKLSAAVFEYDTVSVLGGNFLITKSADKLDSDMSISDTTLVTTGDVNFDIGDILEMKTDSVNIEFFEVTGVTSATTYTVTRDKGGTGVIAWRKGTAIVNYGASGDGGVYMTASENYAPYLSIFTHAGSPWSALTTRLRLGNLNGVLGYTDDKYGIAIGESTKYLKYDPTNGLRVAGHTLLGSLSISTAGYINSGQTAYDTGTGFWFEYNTGTPRISIGNSGGNKITWNGTTLSISGSIILSNNASPSGAGLYIGADYLGYYDSSNWKTYMDSSGNFYLGGTSGSLQWNGTTLLVQGHLRTASSGARVDILPDANTGLIIYDDAAGEVFKALVGGSDVGDVILGSANSYVKWDKSAGSLILVSKAVSPVSNERMLLQNNTLTIYDESGNERVILGKIA